MHMQSMYQQAYLEHAEHMLGKYREHAQPILCIYLQYSNHFQLFTHWEREKNKEFPKAAAGFARQLKHEPVN